MDSVVPPLMFKRWTREEDDVLLSHVRDKGTKKWSLLHASGKLPDRDNKACCNRWRILKAKLQDKCENASVLTDQPTPDGPAPVVPSPAKQEPDTCQFSCGSNFSSPYSCQASSFQAPTAHPRFLSYPSVLQTSARTGSPQSSCSHSGVPTACTAGAGSAPALLPTAEIGESATWMLPGIDLPIQLSAPFHPDCTIPWSDPGVLTSCLVGEARTTPLPLGLIADDNALTNDSVFAGSDKIKSKAVDGMGPASSQCLIGRVIDEPLAAELAQTPAPVARLDPLNLSTSPSHSRFAVHRSAYLQQQAPYVGNADLSDMPCVRHLAYLSDYSILNPSFHPSAPPSHCIPQQTMEEVPRLLRALPNHRLLGTASASNPPTTHVLPHGTITQNTEPRSLLFQPGRSTMHLPRDPTQTMFSGKSMARSWTTGNLSMTAGSDFAQSVDQTCFQGQMVLPSRSIPASPVGQMSAGSFFSESRDRQLGAGLLCTKSAGQRNISLKSSCTKPEQFTSQSEHQQARKRAQHIERNNMLLWSSQALACGPNIVPHSVGPSNGQDNMPQLDVGDPISGNPSILSSNSWAEMQKRWMAKQMNACMMQENSLADHMQLFANRAAHNFNGEASRSHQNLVSQVQELENREIGSSQLINVPCGGTGLTFPWHYAPSDVEGTGLKRKSEFLC